MDSACCLSDSGKLDLLALARGKLERPPDINVPPTSRRQWSDL